MNDKNLHIESLKQKSAEFFSRGEIKWKIKEEEIWKNISGKLDNGDNDKSVRIYSHLTRYAAAAIFIILVGVSAFILFYGKTVQCIPGEHITTELPDGSSVDLNAGSSIKYYPYIWKFSRKLIFEGEGFFEVQKGKNFVVESENGITQVVGTSFNIYARNDDYRVTCLTGQVKVISKAEQSVLLEANSQAELEKGMLVVKKDLKADKIISWKNNRFFFPGTPLNEVIDEIERQYGVTIQVQPKLKDRNFTGNFTRKYNVEEVLNDICLPMHISFVKQSENVFLVVEKS